MTIRQKIFAILVIGGGVNMLIAGIVVPLESLGIVLALAALFTLELARTVAGK